ncbi:MAG: hypothetical protein KJI72_01325 [Patescibacteria group bacterium]|nr:hypothetical protein [Patescibacteria group bacterium]
MQAIFVLIALTCICLVISVMTALDGSERLLKRDARAGTKILGWFLMVVSGGGFILAYTTLATAVTATFFGTEMISSGWVTDFASGGFYLLIVVAGVATPIPFYRKTRKRNRGRGMFT